MLIPVSNIEKVMNRKSKGIFRNVKRKFGHLLEWVCCLVGNIGRANKLLKLGTEMFVPTYIIAARGP